MIMGHLRQAEHWVVIGSRATSMAGNWVLIGSHATSMVTGYWVLMRSRATSSIVNSDWVEIVQKEKLPRTIYPVFTSSLQLNNSNMTLGPYLSFIGGKAPLPYPSTLPTHGDVLRFMSFCATPTFTGTQLRHHVAQTLLDTHSNCIDSHKTLVRLELIIV